MVKKPGVDEVETTAIEMSNEIRTGTGVREEKGGVIEKVTDDDIEKKVNDDDLGNNSVKRAGDIRKEMKGGRKGRIRRKSLAAMRMAALNRGEIDEKGNVVRGVNKEKGVGEDKGV